MNNRFFSKAIVSIVIISIYVSSISVFAVGQAATATAVKANTSFSPNFIVIIEYYNDLVLNSGGRLTCSGETDVQYGYIAVI